MLTISFLTDWLDNKPELLLDDEKAWCQTQAERDAELVAPEDRDVTKRNAYREAVALVVMKKIERGLNNTPDKMQAFLDDKRKQYNDYYRRTYHHDADWSLLTINRTPATSAFRKRK